MAVAALVIEDGGDEDEAVAALLHDAVEDQGGAPTLALIRERFGTRVAAIVEACSDTDETPEAAVAGAQGRVPGPPARPGAAGRRDARVAGGQAPQRPRHPGRPARRRDVFARFNAPREDQAWYYDALATTFAERAPGPMAAELRRVVDEVFGPPA